MNKPDDIPQDVWEIATAIEVMDESVCDWDYNLAIDIAKAIMAAKAEERAKWVAAGTYFSRYCQDEADDVENCVCGLQQHEDAKAFAAAVKGS